MKIGPIKFNCRDRLRKHRGKDRNFDTAAMADVINSPAVQERVAKGDMLGYYGHLPRVMFGIEPGEQAVHKGKVILLEPAICTTRLTATMDGVIEHEVEFLDTAAGRMAKRVHQSKKGGFSSAVSCRSEGGAAVPYGFHGFDFVFEPNFSGNRGYLLDGVFDGTDGDGVPMTPGAVFDSATAGPAAEVNLQMMLMLDGMYGALQADYDAMLLGQAALQRENSELLAMLARKPEEVQRAAQLILASLDSAAPVRRAPLRTVSVADSTLGRTAAVFDSAKDLPGREATAPAGAAPNMLDQASHVLRRLRSF